MRILSVAAVCLCLAGQAFAQDLPKPTGESIVSSDSKLQHLFTRQAKFEGGLTEGAAVAPDGSIYFSDIARGDDKGLIMRFDPRTMKTTVFSKDSHKSNGLIFDAEGYMLACEGSENGGRRVSRYNVKTGKRVTVTDRYQGKKYNAPNDLCVDRFGRIYFTDPRYLGEETRELKHRAVYRIDRDGKVSELTHEVSKPNGIAISADGRYLFLVDHDNGTDTIGEPEHPEPGPMKVYRFPLSADGTVGKRRTIVDFGKGPGCDGITVDASGHVYLTVRMPKRPGVMVIDRDGEEVGFIPTGAADQKSEEDAVGVPSNVEFGIGPEKNVLYITVDTSLFRIKLKTQGAHFQHARKTTSTGPVRLDNVVTPDPNAADEPIKKAFSLAAATHFLDSASLDWQKNRKCMTCHTNYAYLYAMPYITEKSAAHDTVRQFAEQLVVERWKDKGPRWDAEVVATAAALAFNDAATTGRLHAVTKEALDKMWTLQQDDGGWNWLKCDWPPMESDDHYGVTLAAIAVGVAPDDYAKTEAGQKGLAGIRKYLKANPPPTVHHKAMTLWAATLVDGLMTAEEEKTVTSELLSLQKEDGGWGLATLGNWKRGDDKKQDLKSSDGYGTGFLIYVLRRSGVPASDARIQRGVRWLLTNQRASGRWYTRSLHKDGNHFISHAGSAFAVMALSECGALRPTIAKK